MQVSRDGTVRAGRRGVRALAPQRVLDRARAAAAERLPGRDEERGGRDLTPLRFDAAAPAAACWRSGCWCGCCSRGARPGESGRGSLGPQADARAARLGRGAGAALHHEPGALRGVLRAALPRDGAGLPASQLRLERQGEARALPPRAGRGRVRPRRRPLLPRRRDAGLDRLLVRGGLRARPRRATASRMPLVLAAPAGAARRDRLRSAHARFETNRFYQPGLLDAPDPWLWEASPRGRRGRRASRSPGVSAASAQAARARRLPAGRLGVGQRRRPPRERLGERRARGRGAVRGQAALPDEPERARLAAARGGERARAHERRRHGRRRRSCSSTASRSPTRRRRRSRAASSRGRGARPARPTLAGRRGRRRRSST